MTKLVLGILVIIVMVAIVGTSITVDAAGKPTITITESDAVFTNRVFCATDSTAFVHIHTVKTQTGDGNNWKNETTVTGELIEDGTGELIGTYHSKFVRMANFDEAEVKIFHINIVINCLNGEKNEHAHEGFTESPNGELHDHGPAKN